MSLDGALSIAGSGLRNVQQQLDIVSQNVANAGTAGYARESVATQSLTAAGTGFGVRTGPALREIDVALQTAAFQQQGDLAREQTMQTALTAIDATQGTTGAGGDLASGLGGLTDAFTALGAQPSSAAQQAVVVSAAQTLARGVNTLAGAYRAGQQTAQDGLVADAAKLNTALAAIGTLSTQITAGRAAGRSTADLESQRDGQEQSTVQLAGLRFIAQPTGDVLAVVGSALVDLRSAVANAPAGPFTIASATMGAGLAGPPLLLYGQNVSAQVTTGSMGANLALRNVTLPLAQAGIDLFAKTLSNRFDDQGLRLFTDPAGNPPSPTGTNAAASDVGYAAVMQVNPAVLAQPASVRDGTAVSSGGQVPNPVGGPAGFTGLVGRITGRALGAAVPPPSSGLGASGMLALPYPPSSTLAGFAANLLAMQSQASAGSKANLDIAQVLQTTLQARVQDTSGVNVDTELSSMISLQNSYGANAKIITAVQQMFTQLLNAVTA